MTHAARLWADTAPDVLRLAGHPVRWRLLRELAGSDLRVGELCDATGRRQSLVSYHLGRLRGGGMVTTRRSLADRRDTYYVLDLLRCRELFAGVGAALHPALGRPSVDETDAAPVAHAHARVLFLCTGNSARSQMAEALAVHMSAGAITAASAGSHPKPLHPLAVEVMRARGIDLAGRRSKHLDEFAEEQFDRVVTLCDRVREVCPEFPAAPVRAHWSTADPARESGGDDARYAAFTRTADELTTRIRFLMEVIDADR
jgi:ArsR family transcriptional regulator, arsenate/arsenite/antimonite-responsive transcriptional repressor / arsenate reductase (thioredoxin)